MQAFRSFVAPYLVVPLFRVRLIERCIAEDMPDTEEKTMERFLSDEVEEALKALPARDAKVLKLYFGLDGGREHTLEEIGGMLGVTRERVRQLRDRALKLSLGTEPEEHS